MDQKLRVLHVISSIGTGGAETFIMNMVRNMDHEKLAFDFLLQSNSVSYATELESYGCRFFVIPPYYRHMLQNHRQLKKILTENTFQAIHLHANGLFYLTPIIYAKRAGIPCRIVHSHSNFIYYKIGKPLHYFNKWRAQKSATHFFACSEKAGKWMFCGDYTLIPNAIDLDAFAFSGLKRQQYRREWNIRDDTLVIGQVGRLTEPKNHVFSLQVFEQIKKEKQNSLLILVGNGNLRNTIIREIESRGLSDSVWLLGTRNDTKDLLNAFDVFLFPSLFEGMPIAAIEAQANGLPCFFSEAVPENTVIGNNSLRLSLSLGPEVWAQKILSALLGRVDNTKKLAEAGFDIHVAAKQLQEVYLNTNP